MQPITPTSPIQTIAGRIVREQSPSARRSPQQAFAAALGKQMDHPGAAQTPDQKARQAAEDLVSQTFVQPLLKMFRASSNAKPPFAPTQAEKQFRSLMDVELAQRIVGASHFPLVDRLARDLRSRSGAVPAQDLSPIPGAR